MNSHKITYCNSNGFLIKNDRSKFDIIDTIKNKLGDDFLNPLNKSYSDRLLPIIQNNNLLCTYITTGKYVYMYLTKIYNENICLIIELETNSNNKYPKIISVPCNFENKLFEKNTLFYGEIYRDYNNKWFFLIESIKLYNNNIYNRNMYQNIKLINNILENSYKYFSLSPFLVKVKKYFTLDKIAENINKLDLKLKGIKFLGLKNPICFYLTTNNYNNNYNKLLKLPKIKHCLKDNITKIKQEYVFEKNIDIDIIDTLLDYKEKNFILELRKSKVYGIYDLFAINNNSLKKIGIARIDTIEWSNKLIEILKTNKALIVETRLDRNFRKFKILKILKSTSINDYNTIKKELELINKFPIPEYIAD